MAKAVKSHHVKKNSSAHARWKARKAQRNVDSGHQVWEEVKEYNFGLANVKFVPRRF